ncbi:MAG: efflux RND transporter periplasmic adaptor subunit, partial [Candidatus Binatia bacterium]
QAGERAVNVGDYVKKGTTLVSIIDTRSVEVSFGVPDRYSGRVAKGMRVIVSVPGRSDTVEGEVVLIDPAVDPRTRRLRLKAVVDNNDALLKDGQFVELSMVIEVRENRIVIPEEAVLPRAGRSWVYVVEDGVARSREVTVGARLPERIEIISGLQAGEQLVVAGQHRLQDGDRVSPRAK